jgi:hypothetical protein
MGDYKEGGWQEKYYIQKIKRVSDYSEEGRSCGGLKTELEDVDPEAIYFVLRLDEDPHARKAALAYADSVKAENSVFARDIREKVAVALEKKLEEIRNSQQAVETDQPAVPKQPEKHLRVTIPNDSKYDVPARIVADSLAKFYTTESRAGASYSYQEEYDLAMRDDADLIDWAANNMNWDEVAAHAIKVDEPPDEEDFEEAWVNGEKEIVWR